MSTEQQKPPQGSSANTEQIGNWNNRYFQLDPRMARKMRFEADEALKRKPRALPRKVAPYPPLSSWEQQIADVKKLPQQQRAAAYAKILQSLKTTAQTLKGATNLTPDRHQAEQLVLTTALQKLKAASDSDKLPTNDQQQPQQQQPPQQQPQAQQPQQQPQQGPLPEERRKAVVARLDAIKDDLKRCEKAPQTTAEQQQDLASLLLAKQGLAGALNSQNYDQAEKDITQLEQLSAKIATGEAKKRTGEVEARYAEMVKNETPQKTNAAAALNQAIAAAPLAGLSGEVNGAFDPQAIQQLETDTDAANSKLAAVIAASNAVVAEQQKMDQGTVVLPGALLTAMTNLETEALKYQKDHKNVLTKEGKARVKAAEQLLASARETMAKINDANAKAMIAVGMVKSTDGAALSYPMLEQLIEMQKSPYLTTQTKSQAQFEYFEGKKRLGATEDARLLQMARPLDKMSPIDMSAPMIGSVETALEQAEQLRTVEGGTKTQILAIIKNARAKLAQQAQKQLADPNLSPQERATIQLSRCGGKPPKDKGESDSFFIMGPDGKPAYIFKPKEGENVQEEIPEGGGAAREIIASKFNELMKNSVGLDFGVGETSLARLESPQFSQGTNSKATTRVGAVQKAIPNEGNVFEMIKKDPSLMDSIPDEDVQKIAVMDFITLQADRNGTNLLVQDENGKKRLKPIDAGFAFPPKKLFRETSVGMAAGGKASTDRPMVRGQNAVGQFPQSDKPFTPEMLKTIADMKPDEIVRDMKQAVAQMEADAPELKDTVDLEAIDMMGTSIKFLQQAAKEFPPARLQEIYALEFPRIIDADPNDVAEVMKEVIAMAKAQPAFDAEMKTREQKYASLGGDAELEKLGWPAKTDHELRSDLLRKIDILENPNKHQPPPKPQQATQQGPPPDQAYTQLGGDNTLGDLINRKISQVQLTDALNTKLLELQTYETYKANGGDAAYQELVDAKDPSCKASNSLNDRVSYLKYLTEFKSLGGDNELARLSANKDDRIKPWTKKIYDKLRALREYKCVEKDGAEFDQLGGIQKLESAQNDFEAFGANSMPVKLAVLRNLADLDSKGGIARFRSLMRTYKAQSTTLWEGLDNAGKKIRVAFSPYATRKGGLESLNDLEGILDVVTRSA